MHMQEDYTSDIEAILWGMHRMIAFKQPIDICLIFNTATGVGAATSSPMGEDRKLNAQTRFLP